LRELTGPDLRRIADFVKPRVQAREGGRTAIVAETSLEFGFGRMLSNLGEAKEIPVTVQIFRTLREAAGWLGFDESAVQPYSDPLTAAVGGGACAAPAAR